MDFESTEENTCCYNTIGDDSHDRGRLCEGGQRDT